MRPGLPAWSHRLKATPQLRRSLAWAWHHHFGWPAALALVVLATAALLQWQLRPQLLREQARLQARAVNLATAPNNEAREPVREPMRAQELPTLPQRGRDLEWLVTAAGRHGLQLDRADYTTGAATTDGVTRVEATLPLNGAYAPLRRYVADVLNEMPHAALESLQIERPNTQSVNLQATARLVLFYREDGS